MLNKIASKYLAKVAGAVGRNMSYESMYNLPRSLNAPTIEEITPEEGYKSIFPADKADAYYNRMQQKRRQAFGDDAELIPKDAIPTIPTVDKKQG